MPSKSRSVFTSHQVWPAIAIVAIGALAYVASVEASRPAMYRAKATPVAVIDVTRLVDEIDELNSAEAPDKGLRAIQHK